MARVVVYATLLGFIIIIAGAVTDHLRRNATRGMGL